MHLRQVRGLLKLSLLYILRTRNRPPKGFKGKSIESANFNRNDSVAVAQDLICFEKYGAKINGFFVHTNPCVLTAYKELKNNPSKVNDYYKLDRAS